MRFLTILSLTIAQQASAHSGEHAMSSSFYLAHLLGEHGLSLGLAAVAAATVLWVLALRSDSQDH